MSKECENKLASAETPMLSPEKGTLLNEGAALNGSTPKDRFNAIYLAFYLLGLGTLLPWNFFITAQGYWMYKFRDLNTTVVDDRHRSSLQAGFTSYMSVASMVPNTIFLMLNTILSRSIPQRLRLLFSLAFVIILFIVTIILVKVDTDPWQTGFFGFTLFSIVLINCNTAVFQGALFGVGGLFPSQIIQAIMNGQALGGIFAAVANILSMLGGSSNVDSAFGYFIAAVATLVVSLFVYLNLHRFPYYNHYMGQQSGTDMEMDSKSNGQSKKVPFWHIFLKIKVYAISVCLVFAVTLSVYPAVTVLVVSTDVEGGSDWNKKYFIPVGCFLIFNLGDYAGRMAAGWHNLPKTRIPLLPILCVLRVAFIPLFIFCNALPRHNTSVIFNHDAYYLIFMILFSLSSGYLASQAMIHGPKEAEVEHQEAAGAMMAFFLGLGLMLGAALSNAFVLIP